MSWTSPERRLSSARYGRQPGLFPMARPGAMPGWPGRWGNPEPREPWDRRWAEIRFPIIIPCHRVLASNGGLGGFSGGLEMKRFLLNLEKTADS